MEFLGIGPSELLFIVIIALIILGPRDMQKAGRSLGKWMRRIVTSDGWRLFQQTSREIQTLPNRLMRETALDELKEMQQDLKQPLDGLKDLQKDLRQPFQIDPRSGNQPAAGAMQAPQPTEPPAPPSTPDNQVQPTTGAPPSSEPRSNDKDENV